MRQISIKKNTFYSVLKTGASILFPLITFPYISRVLLTDNVGKINFGLSIVSYFSLIASLGISTYAIRECSAVRDDKKKLSDISSQIFSINIITTIIAYTALALTLIFYHKLDNYRLLIIIQSLSIIGTTLGADWLNSAMEDFKYITIRTVAFQFISLILMFIFVHKPEDYLKYAVISLISSVGASIVNIMYRRRYCKITLTFNIDWKNHLKPIFYLFVMLLAQTIFSSVDSTMLGLMHGDYEVGIYSTAHKILNIINQVVGSLLWVIMPRMSYYFSAGNYAEVNKLLRKVLNFNLTLGLPCAIGTIVMAKDIILIIAGETYIDSVFVLQILMGGFVFSLIGGNFLGNAVLLPSKREKEFMIICCICAVINVITNYLLIPFGGPIAAAATTTLCSLIILILSLVKVDKNIKIQSIGKLVIAPVVGCVIVVLVCLLFSHISNLYIRTIVSVATSMIAYLLVQLLLKNSLVCDMLGSVKKKLCGKLNN